jgi:hypothetical protein
MCLVPLNKVRNRAGLTNSTANSKESFKIQLGQKEDNELAFEHDRWFDINRTSKRSYGYRW